MSEDVEKEENSEIFDRVTQSSEGEVGMEKETDEAPRLGLFSRIFRSRWKDMSDTNLGEGLDHMVVSEPDAAPVRGRLQAYSGSLGSGGAELQAEKPERSDDLAFSEGTDDTNAFGGTTVSVLEPTRPSARLLSGLTSRLQKLRMGQLDPKSKGLSRLEPASEISFGEGASPSHKVDRITVRRPATRGFPPIQVLLGWIEESSQRDVLEHARGFAEDHIETLETAWIAMAEFCGGTFFEIHEGGSGHAYLPSLVEELSRDPDQILWVPSGTKLNRAVTLSIVEERPFSMMLNESESSRVRESGQYPVERSGRMKRLSPRGTSIFVVGATLFMIALIALSGSVYMSMSIDQQPLTTPSYNSETLPHGQIISLSTALRDDRWVSRIVFENGSWRAEFEPIENLALPDDNDQAQQMIDKAVEMDEMIKKERERRMKELMSE